MPVGLNALGADVNRVCGNAVVDLASALQQCEGINAMLSDADRFNGSTGLQALGFNVTEAGLLISSFADIVNFASVGRGKAGFLVQLPGQSSPGATDFFFNAKKLMGVNPLQV